jgi:cytoskeleton protein RodZ
MSEEVPLKSVGELLKQGRMRQRLSIMECAKRTHISTRFIEALEEERWQDLPSESHRIGFLRAYSRFLGVSSEQVMGGYQKGKDEKLAADEPRKHKDSPSRSWYTGSWEQLAGLLIVLLIAAWGVFHAISRKEGSELRPNLWTRPRSHQTRLMAPKPTTTLQKVRLHAQADSWLRVSEGRHLLFEGILPAGSTKDWSGQGPFLMRLADPQAVSIFWNDQRVDLPAGSHGKGLDLQLPLAKPTEAPAPSPSSSP